MKTFATALMIFVIGLGSAQLSFGAASSDALEYPELNVVPRASERLKLEAKDEDSRKWSTFLPTQVSSVVLLAASFNQFTNSRERSNPDQNYAASIGLAVSGAWLATTFYLAATYQPYTVGWNKVSQLPNKTQREQIGYERFSEEEIDRAAKLGRTLTWLSFLSHAGAGAYLITASQSSTMTWALSLVATVASISPYVFRYHWGTVASQQKEYKKKIYGPVSGVTLLSEPVTQNLTPGFTLSMQF